MIFTVFDPGTRRVRYGCEGSVAPQEPHLVGVLGDGATQRMRSDLLGLEPKTAVTVGLGPLPVAPDAPLLVTLDVPCRVIAEQEVVATLPAGPSTLAFPSTGAYIVLFAPVDDALYLPVSLEVTVAGLSAPAPADQVAPERSEALHLRLSTLLDRIAVLAQQAQDAVPLVDEIRLRPMATVGEIRTAVRDLGLAVSNGFGDSAEQMRALRRSVMVVREFLRRRGQ